MNEKEEKIYEDGQRQVYLNLLGECIKQLGYNDPEAKKVNWIIEREAVIKTLRTLCEIHGDNDWPDDLHISDILGKHLGF